MLSDPELRAKYDKEGKDGLSADRTDVADGPNQPDPAILFAFRCISFLISAPAG